MNADRKVLALFVLGGSIFVLSRGILDLVLFRGDALNSGNPITRLILAITYCSVAIVLVPYARGMLFVARRNWFLLALVLLALASCLWAKTPGLVLQRSLGVVGTSLLGIAFATRLSLEEQLRLLSRIFRVMAILSLGCILFLPAYGIASSAENFGNWQGIFGYKNMLGAMMALSILVEWHRPVDTRFSKVVRFSMLSISAVLLIFSNAITPLLALGGCLLFTETYKVARHRLRMPLYAIVVVSLLVCASGVTVFAIDSDTITHALGRSSNLTGRTEIWSMVVSYISERPILGYGYSGFWYGSSPESTMVDQALGTPIMYSHDGYLETLLNVGAVGFLLTLVFLGIGLKRAHYWYEREPSRANLWPLAFLSFFLLYNIGECTILLQDVQWALCVAVVASADAVLFLSYSEQEEAVEPEQAIYSPVDELA